MKDKISTKVSVVDLDNTLFIQTFWTHLYLRISKFFLEIALKCERLNKEIAGDIQGKKNIILSGRNLEWGKKPVEQQLKRYRIKYDKIILCPRAEIIIDWKMKEIEKIKEKYGDCSWLDDMKDLT